MKPSEETGPVPGVPADLKGKTWTELLRIFESFAKEKPGATNDENMALGLMFLCALRDGDDARRRAFESDVLKRLAKLEAAAPPPEELDPTKPLCVGDGRPRVKGYEPEPEGAEET